MTDGSFKYANFGFCESFDKEEVIFSLAQKITCKEEARPYLRAGFGFVYNYCHEEAMAAFTEVTKLDPDCAMGYWGVAYAISPHYNWPPGLGSGFDAIQKAMELKDNVSDLEGALIEALSVRSSKEGRDTVDPSKMFFGTTPEMNEQFAVKMEGVYKNFSDSLDVCALYAESLMMLNPWKLWDRNLDTGKITPHDDNTLKIVNILEKSLNAPNGNAHPALLHLYIHCMELSPTPEKALPYADLLRNLMPDAGHLCHMPSHIDAWVGGYKEGIDANIKGVEADEKYVRETGNGYNFYTFYRMHNIHFVIWLAMYEGRYALAMEYARKIEKWLPEGDKNSGVQFLLGGVVPMGAVFLEAFSTMKWHVFIRFGKWKELLEEPVKENKEVWPCNRATAFYARGIAYASLGKVEEAEAEQQKFLTELNNPALSGRVLHNNPMWAPPPTDSSSPYPPSIFGVAEKMLEGEIAYRKGEWEKAWEGLREAVRRDDGLNYDEPWGWMVPARHALGALLLERGEVKEAREVYERDLEKMKENGWGLLGMRKCVVAEGGEGGEWGGRVKKAFERSDVELEYTCFCAGRGKKE